MTTRRPILLLLAPLLVMASGLAACGDDGDDGDDAGSGTTTTTEAGTDEPDDGSTTTEAPADDETTTEAPSDEETTTTVEEGATTEAPSDGDGPLEDLLLDPATLGPEYQADDSLGDGSIDTELCEEVTLEESWVDEAAQALLAGTGDDAVIFQQSVLRFADDAAAEAFAGTLGEALVTCQPGTEVSPLEGIGDEALLATASGAGSQAAAGIVRDGDLVSLVLGITGEGVAPPVDEDLLVATAERLAG